VEAATAGCLILYSQKVAPSYQAVATTGCQKLTASLMLVEEPAYER
jgi:hypothetical protein